MLNRLLKRVDKHDELSRSFIARFNQQEEVDCRAFEQLDELVSTHATCQSRLDARSSAENRVARPVGDHSPIRITRLDFSSPAWVEEIPLPDPPLSPSRRSLPTLEMLQFGQLSLYIPTIREDGIKLRNRASNRSDKQRTLLVFNMRVHALLKICRLY